MRQHNKNLSTAIATLQGVSLIEVLVALLLVSISGFSVLAMSSFSTQESNSLRFEITADYLGRSLLSRVQANANQDNRAIYTFDTNTGSTEAAGDCINGCSSIAVAKVDVSEWTAEVKSILPEVRYQTWWEMNQLHIAIAWVGPIRNNSALNCPFKTNPNEACRVYTANIAAYSATLAYQAP